MFTTISDLIEQKKDDLSKLESICRDMDRFRRLDSTQKVFLKCIGGESLLKRFEDIDNILAWIEDTSISELNITGKYTDGDINLPFSYFKGETYFDRVDDLLNTIEINPPQSIIFHKNDDKFVVYQVSI
jgi:hypothetical protein